jgi:hypothetical protein
LGEGAGGGVMMGGRESDKGEGGYAILWSTFDQTYYLKKYIGQYFSNLLRVYLQTSFF